MSIRQAAGQNKSSFSLADQNPIPGRAAGRGRREGRGRGAFGNKSISGHLPSFSSIIEYLSNHLFQSLDSAAKSFSKELSLHPKQIMNNAPVDTASFIQFTGRTGVWRAARLVFHFPDILLAPFVLVCIGRKLQQKAPRSLNDAYTARLARSRVYIFMESSTASPHPAGAIDSHRGPKDKQTHLSRLV